MASAKVHGNQAQVKRVVTDGYEIVGVTTPFVGTVTSDSSNVPRLASAMKIIAAARRPVLNWKLIDLGLDPNAFGPKTWRLAIQNVSVPQRKERCEMLDGETDDEKAQKLAARLKPQQVASSS
jgi:electron transfer flavoprotein alpha/beta subunit